MASLNLCTDELLMLLAAPGQIASVTHLARDADESPFWRLAQRLPANDGSILSVAGLRPDLIVSMGGPSRDRERLARRIGADYLLLPFPASLDDVVESVRILAAAIGREAHGSALVGMLDRLRRTTPSRPIEGLFVTGGGLTHPPGSLGAHWLTLAGIRLPEDIGARIPAERMLTDPPALIVRSRYRDGQIARADSWPGFRLIERAGATRTIRTDGRLWTCAGPALIPEIRRLRGEIGR